ncbi:Uncharacterized secreted protein [Leminorella richardii]|uniref:Uncharacterized secreted protein n=1 Tax=Leminorella richardii TaxID=158841 RepID=A0A2X4UTW7_9GAMM|nr:spore coat U domain-containing protein [Leminorella richardii]SQI41889.1 Uncharacterized secreted protein [Leminorella richardii]
MSTCGQRAGWIQHTCWLYLFCLPLSLLPFRGSAETQTASLGITAALLPTCQAGTNVGGVTTFGTLNFGSRTLTSQNTDTVGQANAGAISVQCSTGVVYRVVISGGNSGNVTQRRMQGRNIGQTLSYNLYSNASYTTLWDDVTGISQTASGQPELLPVYGRVPTQNTPAADVYQDTVRVTVSW